jgi:hypothetical protein
MASEGMTAFSHPPAHDMDPRMFENLDDITDCNFMLPSNKPRLSDEHTHSINLDSDNPNSNGELLSTFVSLIAGMRGVIDVCTQNL